MRAHFILLLAAGAAAAVTARSPRGRPSMRLRGGARRVAHPELDARLLQRITFGWLNPLVERGSQQTLLDEDLVPLTEEDETEHCHSLFERAYAETASPRDAELPGAHVLRALWRAFGRTFALTGLLKLANDCLQFTGPMLLRATVALIQTPERAAADGARLVLLLFLSSAAQAVLLRHYFFINFRIGVRVNSALMAAVYAKTLRLSSGYLANVSAGEVSNLLTSDAQRIADLLGYLHALWFAPMQVVVALWFLWREIGVSALAGLAMILAVLTANSWLARRTFTLNKALTATADERLRLTAEVFGAIKLVKMNAWEEPFGAKLRAVRVREVRQMRELSAMRAVLNCLFTAAPTLVAAAMLISYTSLGFALEVPSALAVLALVNMLRTPMLFLPIVSNNAVDAVLAARRLGAHLLAPEHAPLGPGDLGGVGLRLCDAHFDWPTDDKRSQAVALAAAAPPRAADGAAAAAAAAAGASAGGAPALRGLDLAAQSGDLIAVVGPVGGGKSALLAALLGELQLTAGSAALRGSVALCPQVPFIARGSVRDNILFGKPLNQRRFDEVLRACALDADVAGWAGGVETELGDRGVNLSGGQKARVALARAVYADADVYLLDDPLAAVDSHVARHLTRHVLGPDGMLGRKLRVVSTHELGVTAHATLVLAVQGGRIVERGPPEQLGARQGSLYNSLLAAAAGAAPAPAAPAVALPRSDAAAPLAAGAAGAAADDGGAAELEAASRGAYAAATAPPAAEHAATAAAPERAAPLSDLGLSADPDVDEQADEQDAIAEAARDDARRAREAAGGGGGGARALASLTAPEDAATGRVGLRLYRVWLRAAGGGRVALAFGLVFALAEALAVGTSWQLTHLGTAGSAAAGLRSYCLLGLASSLLIFGRQILALGAGLRAGSVLHEQLVRRLLRAPLGWFDANPLGRLVNRLSKEQRVLDLQLPSTISQYAQTILVCVSTCALICASSPAALLPLVLAAVAYAQLQGKYVRTATSLRRLEGAARSPILSSALEGIEGAASLRVFGAATAATAEQRRMLDRLGRAVFSMIAANSWLGLRLEIVGSAVVALAALCATLLPNVLGASAGTAGLALASALQLTQVLNWNVRTACELESQMISVERVHDAAVGAVEAPSFLPPPAHGAEPGGGDDGSWPREGALRVEGLSAGYREGGAPVLRDVSFELPYGGLKLAVVGRTGSGKSTLLLCLLRLVEPTAGAVTVDGVDTAALGLNRLRGAIGVVPQEQATFSGTLRDNLDPNGAQTDAALREALRAARLDHLSASLDAPLGAGSGSSAAAVKLSSGQRQLLSIARALLPPRRRLVLMDEPTASVDASTDALMQQLFAEHFADTTTVTVTHRLRTIQRADRVLVLDKGSVVEFGPPAQLLGQPDSALAALVRSGAIERT